MEFYLSLPLNHGSRDKSHVSMWLNCHSPLSAGLPSLAAVSVLPLLSKNCPPGIRSHLGKPYTYDMPLGK